MGVCPSRQHSIQYSQSISNTTPAARARARWAWAIKAVSRRLKLRRLIAIAFKDLDHEAQVFAHLERKKGALTYTLPTDAQKAKLKSYKMQKGVDLESGAIRYRLSH